MSSAQRKILMQLLSTHGDTEAAASNDQSSNMQTELPQKRKGPEQFDIHNNVSHSAMQSDGQHSTPAEQTDQQLQAQQSNFYAQQQQICLQLNQWKQFIWSLIWRMKNQ